MISISVSAIIARKFIKNEMVCAGAFFLIGALGIFVMIISDNMLLKIFGAALAQGTTHGANYCFTCLIPQYFYKMLPYAEAMGLGRRFVALFHDVKLEPCQWYESAHNIPHTASAFYAHYCETLEMLNISLRK